MPDHDGFAPWSVDDAAHPYPIGPINLRYATEEGAGAEVDIALPNAQPTPQTFAERSIGVQRLAQLTFAIRCTTQPNGRLEMVGVMGATHMHFWPSHNEDGPGPEQVFTLTMAELRRGGSKEAIVAHGPHCDVIGVDWHRRQGGLRVNMSFNHFEMTPAAFLQMRERNNRRARRRPRLTLPLPIYPLPPLGGDEEEEGEAPSPGGNEPTPTPTPGEGENPTSGIPGVIGAALASVLERAAQWLRSL